MDTSLTLSMTRNVRHCEPFFLKTAWQSINLALSLPFGLPRSPCGSLAMTAGCVILAYTDKIVILAYFCMNFSLSSESSK